MTEQDGETEQSRWPGDINSGHKSLPIQICVECSVLHELPGNPLCPLQGVQVPMQGSLGGVGESRSPVLLPIAFTFRLLGELVRDYWSPRTVGGCHSVYRVLILLLSKNAEGHLLRIKPEMEEGSLL